DELRKVLGPAEGIRLRLRIREHVQGHQLPASRHERGRREAGVGVLRRGPYEQRLAAARPGTAARAAPVQLHHGRPRGPPRQRRKPGRAGARGPSGIHMGGDRDLARAVADGLRRPRARRQRSRRARRQLLPRRRGQEDGRVQRRAGRQGGPDGARHGPRTCDGGRGAQAAFARGASVIAVAIVLDLVLAGGRVVDGTGAPWFRADVGVRGDRIVAVGDLSGARAKRRIDLRDRMIAPGFIDLLGQSERFLLVDDRVESKIRQGITTEIAGEGESIAPTTPRLLDEVKPFDDRYGIHPDWRDLAGYFRRFRATINLGTFVGAATVREMVLGFGDVQPTDVQLARMGELVAQAMQQGAVGVSSALIYPPGSYARTPELVALAKVAARYGGVYASHVRGEAETLFDALDEAISIGREAHIPVEIWHLKVAGRNSWGRMGEVLSRIEKARALGVDVSANMYPYDAGRNGLD